MTQDNFIKKSAALADNEKKQEATYQAKIKRVVSEIESILEKEDLTFNDFGLISKILFEKFGSLANSITIKDLKSRESK